MGDSDAITEASVMAREYVHRHDLHGTWFELGGSSLDGARLVSRLSQRFEATVTLKELLAAPSVGELLARAFGAPAPVGPAPVGPAPVGATEILWPTLSRLPASDRIALAHRLLGSALASDR